MITPGQCRSQILQYRVKWLLVDRADIGDCLKTRHRTAYAMHPSLDEDIRYARAAVDNLFDVGIGADRYLTAGGQVVSHRNVLSPRSVLVRFQHRTTAPASLCASAKARVARSE